jgi:ectoine hydroxylase-related dioxygenase (phytanoyl-CoA dioxygenase family)
VELKGDENMIDVKQFVTEQDRKFYNENGYWISPKLIDDERIEQLRKAHERVWSNDFDGDGFPLTEWFSNGNPSQLRKIDNTWWINDEVRDMVTDPLLGEVTAALLDTDEVRLWYDQIIYKPGVGKEGSASANVGWHQDYVYWQCLNTTNLVTAWIALQDTDLSNGCMMVVPGSHKWQLDNSSDGFFETDLAALKDKFAVNGREWKEVPLKLKAGQASFHHSLTFHGSGPNLSNDPRLSVVAHLMPKGTAYLNQGHNVDNIRLLGPRVQNGQLFNTQYFPALYSK